MLPGELLVAAIGARRWIQPGPIRFTQTIRARSERTTSRIRSGIRAFLTEAPSGAGAPLADLDWDEFRAHLVEAPSPDALMDKLVGVRADETADTVAVALNCWAFLQQAAPLRERAAPLGPVPSSPGRSELLKFRRVLTVVDDPTAILDDLHARKLTRAQSAAFDACYPEMSRVLRHELMQALVELKGQGDWKLTRDRQRQLESLLQVSSTPAGLMAAYQRGFAQEKANEGPDPGAPSGINVPDLQTATQQVARK